MSTMANVAAPERGEGDVGLEEYGGCDDATITKAFVNLSSSRATFSLTRYHRHVASRESLPPTRGGRCSHAAAART